MRPGSARIVDDSKKSKGNDWLAFGCPTLSASAAARVGHPDGFDFLEKAFAATSGASGFGLCLGRPGCRCGRLELLLLRLLLGRWVLCGS